MVFEPRSLVFRIIETFTIIHPGLFQIEARGINNLLAWDDIKLVEYFKLDLWAIKVPHYSNNSLLGQHPICLKGLLPTFLFVSQNEPFMVGHPRGW